MPPASAVIFIFLFAGIEHSDAGSAGRLMRESVRINYGCDAIADARGKQAFGADKLWIERDAVMENEAARLRFGLQASNLRPGGFGIDEIPGDRRDTAPVVDAGFEQEREIVVTQIWRGLNIHVRAENQARECDGAQHVLQRRLGMRGHGNIRLGAKILDDDFLDVAVFFMKHSNDEERVDALFHGFADADEDAGGERDREFAGLFDGAETEGGNCVGTFSVWQAIAHEARADVFQHQSDAGVGVFQADEGSAVHDAGIGVREKAGFIQDKFAHRSEIVERARVALNAEEFASFGKNLFGLVTEAEKSFLAAGLAPALRERENFVRGHEISAWLAWVLAASAVCVHIAAKSGERDENFL